MAHQCPVCGFPSLQAPPRIGGGGGSYEICPSCGFQFGVSDEDAGITFAKWREQWKKRGSLWSSRGIRAPRDWDAKAQLATLRTAGEKKTTPPPHRDPRRD